MCVPAVPQSGSDPIETLLPSLRLTEDDKQKEGPEGIELIMPPVPTYTELFSEPYTEPYTEPNTEPHTESEKLKHRYSNV